MAEMPAWYRLALHELHTSFWTIARLILLAWGIVNGFGIGVLGQVHRVKQRISRRVPRVSGSLPTEGHSEAH
jgi:hypothetical protein